MEGFQALVTIVPWNFVAQIANLLITMLLVKKFLFQRVQKILDQRQALCNAQLEEAASAREKAEQAQAQYEEALAQAKAEAGEIVKAADRTAAAHSEEILEDARRQAQAMLAKAEADIAQQRKNGKFARRTTPSSSTSLFRMWVTPHDDRRCKGLRRRAV